MTKSALALEAAQRILADTDISAVDAWIVAKALLRLSSERDELVEALQELALLADKMGALHPTRDLREVVPDPAGLSVRIRSLLSKPQEGEER